MDLHPHFLHHSSRYAPLPHPHPPLPPPPPASASTPHPQFPETSNFHPHHHNRYLSQPQPQPQPLPQPPPPLPHISTLPRSYQQSLPPPPPPPPPPPSQHHNPHHHKQYNPNQPQFAFSSATYAHPVQDFTQVRRIDDRPRHRLPELDHTRPDFSDPSRVLPDTHHRSTEKPYHPPLVLDRNDAHQRQRLFDRLADQFRHDSEGSSRFRVEYDDGFDPNHRHENLVWGRGDDNYHRRGHVLSNSDTSSRDFGFVSNSRDIEPNSGVYDYRFGSVPDNEAYRSGRSDGGHDRQASRDVSDLLYEMGSNESGEGVHIGSTKHEYYGLDVARYNHNRGSREGSHEYNHNHTPRKQIQKKSAFLRIQMAKPNHRSRESERSHYSGYFDKTNSGSFRGRDQYMNSGYGMEEEEEQERQGSPVELDVSFKSNSLVAKAIVAPSSSAVVSDADLTPRNEKTRKVSDGDRSNSRLSKLQVGAVNMDSSTGIANKASTSRKDSKQFEKRVMTSVVGSVHDGNSQPCSSGASVSLGKSAVERSPKGLVSHKDGTVAGSGKTTAPKVVKKKKVVKKVVKKVINRQSRISSSQQTKKFDEPFKADDSTHNPAAASGSDKNATPSEQIRTSDGMTSRSNVFLQPCTDKVNVLPENDVADISSLPTVSYDCGINIDSSRICVPSIKRNLNNSTSPLVSSSREENKIEESPVNADNSVQSSQSISNSDNDLRKPSNEINFSGVGSVENVSRQFYHEGLPLLLEKGREKEFTNENVNSAFLSSEEIKIHEDITNSCSSPHGTDGKLGFENDMVKSQENSTVCDIGIKDAIKKEPGTNQFTTSFVNSTVEEFHEGLVGSSAILGSSSSEEIDICQGLVYAECSNHGRDATRNSDNGHSSLEEKKNNVFNRGTINIAGKHPSPGGATVSHENFGVEESLNGMVLVRACEGNTLKIKKRRITRTQLDFSNSTDINVEPVNDAVSPETPANTTLNLSVKGSCPAEVAVSDVGSLDVGILPGADGISVLHAKSSVPGLSEVKFTVKNDVHGYLTETSPRYKKKRGVSVSDSALSRPTVSEINEGPTGTSTCCADVSLTSNDDLTQQEGEVAVSSINNICSTGFTVLIENTSEVRFAEAVGATRDVLSDDYLKLFDVGVESCSHAGDPNAQSPCPSGFGSEQKENSAPFIADNINQNDVMDIDTSGGEKMEAHDAKNKVLIHGETPRCKVTSEPQSPDLYQRLSNSDMESDYLLVKDDLPPGSNYLSLSDDGAGVSSSNTNDEVMDAVSGTLPDIGLPEISAEVLSIHMLNCKAPPGQLSNEKVCGDDQKYNQKTVVEVSSNAPAHTSFPQSTKLNLATEIDHSIMGKTVPLPSQDSKLTSHSLNLMSAELMGSKTQLIHSLPKTFPGHSSFFSNNSKKTASSTHIGKPRTWHRTGNPSVPPLSGNKPFSNTFPPRRKLVEDNGRTLSTSYIRKGNSLVRKPALVAAQHQGSHGLSSSVYRANSSVTGESRKSTGSDGRFDDTDPQNLLRTGMHTPVERPGTPPLPNGSKLPTQNAVSSGDKSSSSQMEHPYRVCCETTLDPMKLTEANNLTKTAEDSLKISEISENLTGTSNNLESQTELSDGNVSSFNTRRIVYVKRKSNQLVATSSPCDLSVQNGSKVQAGSEGYYKRSKNQLIRASLENQIKQSVAVCDDLLNSERQQAPKVVSSRKFSKRRLHKVVAKTCKPMKSSLVWTLRGMQSSKDERDSLHHQKVLPHLFPWKRGTYWRNFMHDQIPISNNSSLSMISRKLLLLRRRDTVYTRSINGFSLRKFKVLSVGGSSLKWSKSIEKNSKKANEEATLAVAAVERKKREQNGAARSSSRTKNRNHSSRERIFRIGSVRYKMDPTKQTLQRISDDECTGSTAAPSEKDAKKSYIPRRLVIDNDEYVRIGNGNQLIRDPKKRTRKLASEKVRWSLHTARLRLARKRKYCQFFTRFGKCNKDDGKCPYIHDSSKIAVCTKFLNGLCSNPNCKLTHKVIPERMPDCSYFLQGLCNNRSCPYRHVNVNPKASTCEGFLRGYCADGNECRKKHSYVCPVFEATGTCPQGSKCKLHHPKNRSKGKKRKRAGAQKNARGRYFGSMHINVSEPGTTVFEKNSSQNNEDILLEGKFADYIRVDVSDEEVGESNDPASEQTFCDSDLSDVQFDDLDQLIKPVRIMSNKFED